MIRALLLGCACLWSCSPVWALDAADARHLLERVAFGMQPGDLQRFGSLNREQAVDLLLSDSAKIEPPDFPPVAAHPWQADYWTRPPINSDYRKQRTRDWATLYTWYFDRVLHTRTPLRERMVLFWHQHFPNTDIDVAPQLFWQDQTFREGALGNYVDLLRAFSRDGANIRNLNLFTNRQGRINENFGRELLELYSIGVGHYQEADIREVSRAFTGWRTWRSAGVFVKWYPWHDFGEKTVLGRTGRFDGDDVISILAAQPRFAEVLVEKLWREFVSLTPDVVAIRRLAADFRKDYRIDALLRAVLTEDAFWAPENRLILVKSPVELVVASLREIGLPQQSHGSLGPVPALWAAAMGQKMFLAPDVKGWRGHTDWLTVATLPMRYQFVHSLGVGFEPSVVDRIADDQNLNTANSLYRGEDFRRDTLALWMRIERMGAGSRDLERIDQRLNDLSYQLR